MLSFGELALLIAIPILYGVWIWGFVDAVRSNLGSRAIKGWWLALIILVPFIGAASYLIHRYRQEILALIERDRPNQISSPHTGKTRRL
jgi:membrane protein implicated in regulation of membrane protease activity